MVKVSRCFMITGLSGPVDLFLTEAELEELMKSAYIALNPQLEYERCAVCGCTEYTPCVDLDGPCAWANEEHTLCTACIGASSEFPGAAARAIRAVETVRPEIEDIPEAPKEDEYDPFDDGPKDDEAPEPIGNQMVTEPPQPMLPSNVAEWQADKIEEKWSEYCNEGLAAGKAITRIGGFVRGLSANTIREVLRIRGHEVPDPISPQERSRLGREAAARHRAIEAVQPTKVQKTNPAMPKPVERQPAPTPKPLQMAKPAERIPPPPPKVVVEPARPTTVLFGSDHVGTVQAIRMILIKSSAPFMAHELHVTISAVEAFAGLNAEWIAWLDNQPPFRVNDVLQELAVALKPIESRGSARPKDHAEEAA